GTHKEVCVACDAFSRCVTKHAEGPCRGESTCAKRDERCSELSRSLPRAVPCRIHFQNRRRRGRSRRNSSLVGVNRRRQPFAGKENCSSAEGSKRTNRDYGGLVHFRIAQQTRCVGKFKISNPKSAVSN